MSDLRVGMYVCLPLSWHEHAFLKNSFTIDTAQQIIKLKKTGLQEVTIDTDRGIDVLSAPIVASGQRPALVEEPLIPDALMEALRDKQLPAIEKAGIIHKQSAEMMHRLFDNPTAQNIKTAKQGVAEVVKLILTDDSTAHHLMLITSHDFYTYTHSVTVGIMAVSLSKALFQQSDGHDMNELGAGFFLHDLGKVHINQEILNKPGRLMDQEMKEVRKHPGLGFKLLNESRQLTEECKLIVLQHHERWDGTGYPKGLKGDEIHVYGRICAIADVYDALTSNRPYRQPLSTFEALQLMRQEMLEHFHRDLFEQFVKLFSHTP